jgi:hypothetical protein
LEGGAQTWHYGLIAKWWAEFNDDFRTHEIPYFQRHIEQGGEPALEVGCGTGRLLIPILVPGWTSTGATSRRIWSRSAARRLRARDCRRCCSCRQCTDSTRRAGTRRSSSAARSGRSRRGWSPRGCSGADLLERKPRLLTQRGEIEVNRLAGHPLLGEGDDVGEGHRETATAGRNAKPFATAGSAQGSASRRSRRAGAHGAGRR